MAQAELLQLCPCGVELAFAAIDKDQIRQWDWLLSRPGARRTMLLYIRGSRVPGRPRPTSVANCRADIIHHPLKLAEDRLLRIVVTLRHLTTRSRWLKSPSGFIRVGGWL